MKRRNVLVPMLIATNVLIFLAWSSVGEAFMQDNFTVSWLGLSQGRIWTLLTSEFSHVMFWHLLFNMIVLNSFGGILESVLPRRMFLALYFSAAIVASLGHACVSNFILNEPGLPAVGASGAISGLLLVFALMFPRERILLFFILPLPALFGVLAFVALDLWGLVEQAEGGGLPIGHGAHLGGALTGVLFYWFFIRRRWREVSRYYEME